MFSLSFGLSALEERKGQMKSTMPRACMVLLERCRPVLLLTVFVLAFTTMVFAQRDMGTITGTVTDAQGGVVPNAKITITEVDTGLKYEVQSGSDGTYIRPALKPGTYSITAELKGFHRVEHLTRSEE